MIGKSNFKIGGNFNIKCYDKDGNLKWREYIHNFVVNEGLDKLLDIMFHADTQVNPFYVGLAGAGTKAITDTLASHAAWSEITTYTGDRKEFVEGAASSQSISNTGNLASFSINGDCIIAGAFLTSVATTDTGFMFCVSDFASQRQATNPDTITVEYTLSASDS